jgi:hypothetical protein
MFTKCNNLLSYYIYQQLVGKAIVDNVYKLASFNLMTS